MSVPVAEGDASVTLVHPLLAERWSPRSFDPEHVLSEAELASLVEAARWAPSARNRQPWRFLAGQRGSEAFRKIFASLMDANQLWAGRSSLLVVAVAAERDAEGQSLTGSGYDTGLAVAQLSVQAHALGLHAHQMGGFHADRIREAFAIPEGHIPVSVTAVGQVAPAELLPQPLRDRELASRERRPREETFFSTTWGQPLLLPVQT
ncbi:nitroreductase family protein [Streptacidiphilus neutrinimicus]|uniref:nitroreductase family protein n=1 Tax=Streptacidiphilus neutrinimicus TaxID=105420 RepID=UPI0005A6D8C7|nr:nitroreductase family protein [Streptacidiphilus neutrinimicus]